MSMFVYKGEGGQKCPEFCLRGLYTVPYIVSMVSPVVIGAAVQHQKFDLLDFIRPCCSEAPIISFLIGIEK